MDGDLQPTFLTPDLAQRFERLEHILGDLDESLRVLALRLGRIERAVCHAEHYGLGRRGVSEVLHG